jgi:hypothetical protein
MVESNVARQGEITCKREPSGLQPLADLRPAWPVIVAAGIRGYDPFPAGIRRPDVSRIR